MADAQCTLCDTPMLADQPIMELPCNHRYHTACAFRRFAVEEYDVLDMTCFEHGCRMHIVPQEVLDLMEGGTRVQEEEDVVNYLAEGDENFKEGIKKIRDMYKVLKRDSAACGAKVATIAASAKADLAVQVLAVKNRLKEARKALATSAEYKALTKSSRSMAALTGASFNRRWGIDYSSVRRILRKKTGFRDTGCVWNLQPAWHARKLVIRRML